MPLSEKAWLKEWHRAPREAGTDARAGAEAGGLPYKVGDRVEANWAGKWFAAEVVDLPVQGRNDFTVEWGSGGLRVDGIPGSGTTAEG